MYIYYIFVYMYVIYIIYIYVNDITRLGHMSYEPIKMINNKIQTILRAKKAICMVVTAHNDWEIGGGYHGLRVSRKTFWKRLFLTWLVTRHIQMAKI